MTLSAANPLRRIATLTTLALSTLTVSTLAWSTAADPAASTSEASETLVVTPVVVSRGTEPVPIERSAPNYPRLALRQSAEAWVVVAFDIDETGHPVNAEVLESSADGRLDEAFRAASLEALGKWRYEPAMVDDVPTLRRDRRNVFTYQIADMDGSISRQFYAKYRKVSQALEAGDTAAAREVLDELQERPRNLLSEQAYLEMLEAMWFEKTGDMDKAREHVRRGVMVADNGAIDVAQAQLLRMAVAHNAMNHDLHAALGNYESLKELDFGIDDDDPIHDMADRIRAALDSDQPLVTEGQIVTCDECRGQPVQFSHALNRPSFMIQVVDGAVDAIRIECGPAHTAVAWDQNMVWNVTGDPADCEIDVTGEDGTEIRLIEFPNESGARTADRS